MADVKIDCLGMQCPQPLVETRKALRKMNKGKVLEVVGDHAVSFKEIPMVVKETGDKVLSAKETGGGKWKIEIKKG
jgi:tRNA 2-thiouridine synthesizing protein A